MCICCIQFPDTISPVQSDAILSDQAYLMFGDDEYLYLFKEAYKAVMRHLHFDPWSVNLLRLINFAVPMATIWPFRPLAVVLSLTCRSVTLSAGMSR